MLSNYVANSAMTPSAHLPQLKSIRSDIVELGLLLLLDYLLRTTPQLIMTNFDGKNPVDRRVEYPAEKCGRHEENLLTTVYSTSPPITTYALRHFN